MPIYKKCCVCGRLCDIVPKRAEPFSIGVCCNECYIKQVIPAKKKQDEMQRRKQHE